MRDSTKRKKYFFYMFDFLDRIIYVYYIYGASIQPKPKYYFLHLLKPNQFISSETKFVQAWLELETRGVDIFS